MNMGGGIDATHFPRLISGEKERDSLAENKYYDSPYVHRDVR